MKFVPYHEAIEQYLLGQISLVQFLSTAIIPHGHHDKILEALKVFKDSESGEFFDETGDIEKAILAQKTEAEEKDLFTKLSQRTTDVGRRFPTIVIWGSLEGIDQIYQLCEMSKEKLIARSNDSIAFCIQVELQRMGLDIGMTIPPKFFDFLDTMIEHPPRQRNIFDTGFSTETKPSGS